MKTAAGYDMEFGSKKSKILVKSIKPRPSTKIIWMNGKALEDVNQFKYSGSTEAIDGTSIKEVKIRLAQAYSAITRRATILWKDKAISFPPKIKLCKSLVNTALMDVRAGR